MPDVCCMISICYLSAIMLHGFNLQDFVHICDHAYPPLSFFLLHLDSPQLLELNWSVPFNSNFILSLGHYLKELLGNVGSNSSPIAIPCTLFSFWHLDSPSTLPDQCLLTIVEFCFWIGHQYRTKMSVMCPPFPLVSILPSPWFVEFWRPVYECCLVIGWFLIFV